ncbi:MAG TPA: PVC-type heme-binding CxxCH protein [Methylomirabilota bacterium]|nr:PVC-type heme-binding CxxCH protein [Methylomirabilota bacterium]
MHLYQTMNRAIHFVVAVLFSQSTVLGASSPPPADVVPFAGLSPEEACERATLPPGFKMHVFASEPDLVQPIAFCLDDRGRVWVAEGRTYPRRQSEPPREERGADADLSRPTPAQVKDIFGGRDRVLVLEDTDGDHKFDRKTVFLENVNLISGIEVGFGGVWIGAAPYLLFFQVRDWDDPKPAGDPRILLDGWDYKADTHETLNTFAWGPDGWLYGCHGVFCPSHVGKPGAPVTERQWMDAGVWRYHPVRHVFEVFTEGGSNPWGIDFNEHGQLFAEMCVIPHFWHMIQGARIERQGGEHFPVGPAETRRFSKGRGKPVHPHIYEDIKQHGDHVHWAGAGGPHAGNARSDAAGGGHAHAGVLCYLGESWPAEYRGRLFLGNIHGQRLNVDIPERRGSGYVGRHGKDFLNFNDKWSQTLNQLCDPDGSVLVIDWYDKNQCHHGREDGHDRSNGRIYKIVYNQQRQTRRDLAALSDEELVKLVTSKNEFLSRHARRLLQERAAGLGLQPAARTALKQLYATAPDTEAKLRALWALHLTGSLDAPTAIENLRSRDEWVRAWTIQLAFESPENLRRLIQEANDKGLEADPDLRELAESDPSAVVRLFLASAAQRIESDEFRMELLQRLLRRAEDATDHNLPLMYWYALEPLVEAQPETVLAHAVETKLPRILNFTTRRLATLDTSEARALITRTLAAQTDATRQREMLAGLAAALKGRRNVPMPEGWDTVESRLGESADADVRTLVRSLSVTFGSERALAALRRDVAGTTVPVPARRAALESLVNVKDPALPDVLLGLLAEAEMRGPALRALAGYNDPRTPGAILAVYGRLDDAHKRDALNTLVSRPAFARPLLESIVAGQISARDLTADILRQLRGLKDADTQALLVKAYGPVRESSADKKAEIEKYRRIYAAGYSQPGDASRGRVLFNKVCAQCHTLFDVGGKVGPDITGANRGDLAYLLETIVDPNAVIPNEYRTTEIETRDGRSLTGVVKVMGDTAIQLQTANELVVIPRAEIASQRQTELSMMPEGLLAPLSDQEVRDLLYYVSRPGQVPLPAETEGTR